MAQFILMGYFMLGGAYAMQLGSAVRMDLLYMPLVGHDPGNRRLPSPSSR